MFENRKILLEDPLKIERRTEFHNGFSHGKIHFRIVILGFFDAVYQWWMWLPSPLNHKNRILDLNKIESFEHEEQQIFLYVHDFLHSRNFFSTNASLSLLWSRILHCFKMIFLRYSLSNSQHSTLYLFLRTHPTMIFFHRSRCFFCVLSGRISVPFQAKKTFHNRPSFFEIPMWRRLGNMIKVEVWKNLFSFVKARSVTLMYYFITWTFVFWSLQPFFVFFSFSFHFFSFFSFFHFSIFQFFNFSIFSFFIFSIFSFCFCCEVKQKKISWKSHWTLTTFSVLQRAISPWHRALPGLEMRPPGPMKLRRLKQLGLVEKEDDSKLFTKLKTEIPTNVEKVFTGEKEKKISPYIPSPPMGSDVWSPYATAGEKDPWRMTVLEGDETGWQRAIEVPAKEDDQNLSTPLALAGISPEVRPFYAELEHALSDRIKNVLSEVQPAVVLMPLSLAVPRKDSDPSKCSTVDSDPLKPGTMKSDPLKPRTMDSDSPKCSTVDPDPLKPRTMDSDPLKPRTMDSDSPKCSTVKKNGGIGGESSTQEASAAGAMLAKPVTLTYGNFFLRIFFCDWFLISLFCWLIC